MAEITWITIILKLLLKLTYELITVSFLETIRRLLFLMFYCKTCLFIIWVEYPLCVTAPSPYY